MSTANSFESLNGLFKQTYADKLESLIPEGLKWYNAVKFVGKEQSPGAQYNQPVKLAA